MRKIAPLALALSALVLASFRPTEAAPVRAGGALPSIVSLNPCSDAILSEIAAPGQIRAISHYSHDPRSTSMPFDEARRYAKVGDSIEEALAFKPDIVVAGAFMPEPTRRAYESLGVRVEALGIASTLPGSMAQIREIGRAIGREQAAEKLVQRIENFALQRGETQQVSAVLWQPGSIVPGDGALISELMRRAGFSNHSAKSGFAQADYLPLEVLLASPPRALIIAGDERAQRHPALSKLAATTHIAHVPASILYCGGPSIIPALKQLRAIRAEIK